MKVLMIVNEHYEIVERQAYCYREQAKKALTAFEKKHNLEGIDVDAGGLMLVEIDVDEYPDTTDLHNWLNTLTNPSNLPDVLAYLKRADDAQVYYEVLNSAYEQQSEPDFDIVKALEEACLRWDV